MNSYTNLTLENLEQEHLCCIIRSKKRHLGVEAKRKWLSDRLKEGHVFRKLNEKATVFIEYAPLEKAWVPIIGDNYNYIYCLWVLGDFKGKGYGKELLEYAINDAKNSGKSGLCMIGSEKQKAWLSDQNFAKRYGFEVVDTTNQGYQLLALSFDGTMPRFAEMAKAEKIENKELVIYYDMQCPYVLGTVESIRNYCELHQVPIVLHQVMSLQQAKELPCVFNNWAIFYHGKFQTVNLLDIAHIKKILEQE